MQWHLLFATLLVVALPAVILSQEDDLDDDDITIDESQYADADPALFEDDEEEEEHGINVPKQERPIYKVPVASGKTYFTDAFVSEAAYRKNWMESKARKDDTDESIAKYDGVWSVEEPEENPLQGDLSLVLKSKAKHHATAAKLKSPYVFEGKPFIVQFEVKFQNGQDCGGAYVKLLSEEGNSDLKKFYDKSPYTIMFGPDKCGNDNKLHFIFRHQNPITGEFEEKHIKKPSGALDKFFTDKKTHLYTLIVKADNSFEVLVDQAVVNSGNLLNDVSPPVNPPKEITDPEDKKPADWDEREKIADPTAEKPDDWDEDEPEKVADVDAVKPEGWLDDEPDLIPDEDSEKPADWDEDMDGEWEPPMISNPSCEEAPGCGEWTRPVIKNPKYKGKWRAPMIDNTEYKGKWMPRMIANPKFFEDNEPYKMMAIGAVGLELWSMSSDIAFDNFIITDDIEVARQWAQDTWELKHTQELSGGSSGSSVVDAVMDATNERPWLWAVFIIVILLPIVLVIAYCCMPSSSGPKWLSFLWESAMERKWLLGVYVVVLLLPLAILSVWLCPNAGPGVKQSDIAERKKTDAPTPDDEKDDEDEEDDDEDEDEGKEEAAGDAKPTVKGKGQLDASTEEKKDKKEKKEKKAEEQKGEETEATDEPPKTRSSPRKRKGKASTDS